MSPITLRSPRIQSLAALSAAAAVTIALGVPLRSADLRPEYRPAAYAIQGARIVTGLGKDIDRGTVVVREGVIEAVGPVSEVAIPHDAEVVQAAGMIVYPGFLDLYTNLGQGSGGSRSLTGPGRTVNYADFALAITPTDNRNGLTPEFEVATALDISEAAAEERRKVGFTDVLSAPAGAIATGKSLIASLNGNPRREAIVKSPTALHINIATPFDPTAVATDDPPGPGRRRIQTGGASAYPNALMGAVAHLRQAMLDAEHAVKLQAHYSGNGGVRPAFDPTLRTLADARARVLPVWWEANSRDEIHRVLDLAEEFGTSAVIVGGREAWKVTQRLKARNVPVVLRIDFPDEPKVPSEEDFRRQAIEEREDAYKTLLDRQARWRERVRSASVLARAGVKFSISTQGLTKADTFPGKLRQVIDAGLPKDVALRSLTVAPSEIVGLSRRLGTIEAGKSGHLFVATAPIEDEKFKVRYSFIDGVKFDSEKPGAAKSQGDFGKGRAKKGEPAPTEKPELAKAEPAAPPPVAPASKAETKGQGGRARTKKAAEQSRPFADVAAETDEDRRPKIRTGGDLLIRNATILTVTKGTIAGGSILIRNGKIAELGRGLSAPEGVFEIDARGCVVMPGIIDTHSHMAIQGSVNETSLSIVPEVRVKDVVTNDDPGIYRALAGGTTTARLLHGSANTIGGQDAVVKLKPNVAGRDMIVRDGPQGVKFALGENVTRSRGRFPNTRMGVEAVIERAFEEGKAYKASHERHDAARKKGGDPAPVRRDLRLEALARILDGSIRIHSHCYRSDEILMLLRTVERFGVRVRSLQHVLEGYKVAAEIAEHGASASTFSDWWAYKVEAFDAVPFNAALLTKAGASVCIKSDSAELVRHLYLEAAKMVKYGGVDEKDALAMVTINPARELGLEHRIGSIEVGKDADLAIFNAHPFDGFARCEMSIIEGEVFFHRAGADERLVPRPGNHERRPSTSAEALARSLHLEGEGQGVYALTGATIHTITGADIPNGTLVVSGRVIRAVGGPNTPIPAGSRSIDVRGLDVWPGMIDAGGATGLFEVGSLNETQDFSDSAKYQPELRAAVALHPDSELIPVTRANGVLSSFVQPTGGSISGQGAVINHDGWLPTDLVLKDRAALSVNIPTYFRSNPDSPRPRFFGISGAGGAGGDEASRRREALEELKEQFRRASAYDKIAREALMKGLTPPAPDPRLVALAPYAKGAQPVMFRANRVVEILDAIKISKELKLKAVITGGTEAWKVAAEIKAAGIPVILSGTLYIPRSETDPYDSAYASPSRLHAAGVDFAIRSGGPDQGTASRNLPYEAAVAVAYGLPEAEALKAVTIAPARILGVSDDLGSIEVGKLANLVITAGHLLQPTTEVKGLFIAGKPISPESRHTRLFAKYSERLDEIRSGKANIGLERTRVAGDKRPSPGAPTGGSGGAR